MASNHEVWVQLLAGAPTKRRGLKYGTNGCYSNDMEQSEMPNQESQPQSHENWKEALEEKAATYDKKDDFSLEELERIRQELKEDAEEKIVTYGKIQGILREMETLLDKELAKSVHTDINSQVVEDLDGVRNDIVHILEDAKREMDEALEKSIGLKEKIDVLRKGFE